MALYDRLSFFHPGDSVTLASDERQRADHQKRIIQQYAYWRFYNGKHWDYQKEENVPQVTLNYCRAFVNKSVAFLFSKGFKFKFPTVEEENAILPVVQKLWDEWNERDLVCLLVGQVGSVTGDAYIYVTVEDSPKREDRKIVFIPLDAVTVIPTFKEDSSGVLSEVAVFYKRWNSRIEKEVTYVLQITEKEFVEYEDDVEIPGSRVENVLGLVPVIHISNAVDAGSKYGISDLEDIALLNKEYNEKATDVSDVLDYLGQPVVVVKGANANKINGTGRIWAGLPINSSVDILNLNAPMTASVDYLRMLKLGMHEVSGIPQSTLGEQQNISNTSGVAIHMQYMPLLEKTWMKRITYGRGIKQATELALKYMEQKKMVDESVLSAMKYRYKVDVAWNDPLPKDMLNELNMAARKMEIKIASRRSIMREMGIENIQQIEDELAEEMEKEVEKMFAAQEIAGAGPSGFEEGTGVHTGETQEKRESGSDDEA